MRDNCRANLEEMESFYAGFFQTNSHRKSASLVCIVVCLCNSKDNGKRVSRLGLTSVWSSLGSSCRRCKIVLLFQMD